MNNTILGLVNLEKLSRLSYYKRYAEFWSWIKKFHPVGVYVRSIQGNDRLIIFQYKGSVIMSIAGSDDKADWKENFIIKTIKRLWYSYKGFADPAEAIAKELEMYCDMWSLDIKKIHIEQSSHSRGGGISKIVQKIFEDKGIDSKTFTWGAPPSGGRRFCKRAKTDNTIEFQIKGDPVPRSNPFGKANGKVIKLPKQIKGFFYRIKQLFKGNMNHRSYNCIKDIYPYYRW